MSDQYIKIIYNEDSDQFEAYYCSDTCGEKLILFSDCADDLLWEIENSIDELKASC